MALFNIKLDIKHLEKYISDMNKIKKLHVEIGIDAGASYPSGIPVSEVATYLEYGWVQSVSDRQSGWFTAHGFGNIRPGATLNMPPRPIFEYTSTTYSKEWVKLGSDYLKGIGIEPYKKIMQALEAVGLAAQQDLVNTINTNGDGSFAPRSAVTMALYSMAAAEGGHRIRGENQTTTDKALYKSGILAGSIIYNIVNK